MKRSSKIILTVALTVGLIGGVAAYGKHRFGDPTKMAEHVIERVSDELDLSGDQAKLLRGLSEELLKMKTQVTQGMGVDRQVVRDMITADNFDQAKALALLNSKATAIQRNAPSVIAAFGTFVDSLTPEQKAEITQHMDHHHGRHHGKHDEGLFDGHRKGHSQGHTEGHKNN
ncbi:MAG: protein CpxP [Gammaproteobacteria bacterium]|jgi:protein CpxP